MYLRDSNYSSWAACKLRWHSHIPVHMYRKVVRTAGGLNAQICKNMTLLLHGVRFMVQGCVCCKVESSARSRHNTNAEGGTYNNWSWLRLDVVGLLFHRRRFFFKRARSRYGTLGVCDFFAISRILCPWSLSLYHFERHSTAVLSLFKNGCPKKLSQPSFVQQGLSRVHSSNKARIIQCHKT